MPFERFQDGRPVSEPVDFVYGFLQSTGKARGQPVGVTVDPRDVLIITDDLSNTIAVRRSGWKFIGNQDDVRRHCRSIEGARSATV